ncbi:MAG: enoyl-CoA hydratase/carnithine racemase [Gammaproteobacteria bacterium]|jgi:enoyl-CoA hydratase/carnithine racemase
MTKTDTDILAQDHNDGLLTLSLNRPGNANALNLDLTEALITAVTQSTNTHLCVIRGEGKHFCAGFDLSDLENMNDSDLLWRILRIETMLQAIHHAPFPVVALAQGQLVGAGADLFAGCWRRVATADAKFRMPGWNFELALGTRRLTHLVGHDSARDMLIDTKVLSANQSLANGLATDITEQEAWPELIEQLKHRTSNLSALALKNMLELTTIDNRDRDLASIVKTAGRPGLKDRIIAYRNQIKPARK